MFEITVREITVRAGENDWREDSKEVYSQRVEELDLKAVIRSVNEMPPVIKFPEGTLR